MTGHRRKQEKEAIMEKIENGNVPPLKREFSVGGPAYAMDDDQDKKNSIPTNTSASSSELVAHSKARGATAKKTNNEDDELTQTKK
jgi:hypothetical protein